MNRKQPRKRVKNVCPPIGTLMRYRDRIVRVLGEATGSGF
jgi:hypothetical protein